MPRRFSSAAIARSEVWPSSPRGDRASETETQQIKLVDEKIHGTYEAILADPVVQPIRKKHRLAAINALDETRHARLRPTCQSLPRRAVSTQPRPKAVIREAYRARLLAGNRVERFLEVSNIGGKRPEPNLFDLRSAPIRANLYVSRHPLSFFNPSTLCRCATSQAGPQSPRIVGFADTLPAVGFRTAADRKGPGTGWRTGFRSRSRTVRLCRRWIGRKERGHAARAGPY